MYSHVISVVSSVQYEVGNQGCLYLLEWNMEWNSGMECGMDGECTQNS